MSKSVIRRMYDSNFATRIFKGTGIDIGGFPDPLTLYLEFFPLITTLQVWDIKDGDAQFMDNISDEFFNFVVSSHCLEHLNDPFEGLKNWFRIIKPSGYLVVTVPDEDLYEQGIWPSNKNYDHRFTFTINKNRSWSANSINVIDLIHSLGNLAEIKKIELLDRTHRFNFPKFDQTLTPLSESGIEIIIRKRTLEELGNFTNQVVEPKKADRELNRYLNQYAQDQKTLREHSLAVPPFQIESEVI